MAQRDNEIGILVSMLKRREGAGAKAGPVLSSPSTSINGPPVPGMGAAAAAGGAGGGLGAGPSGVDGSGAGPGPGSAAAAGGGGGPADELAVLMNTNLLADRNKAFELFRKSYRQNEVGVTFMIVQEVKAYYGGGDGDGALGCRQGCCAALVRTAACCLIRANPLRVVSSALHLLAGPSKLAERPPHRLVLWRPRRS